MCLADCRQGREQGRGHGADFPLFLVHMQLHDFIARHELLGFSVIHAVEKMHTLFITAQHLRFNPERLTEFHFLIVADVGFRREEGVACSAVSFVITDIAEECIKPVTEGDEISGICHVAVIVEPCRKDFALVEFDLVSREITWSQSISRFVEPEEIADMCLFLASPAAKMVNGQDIAVDGHLETMHIR